MFTINICMLHTNYLHIWSFFIILFWWSLLLTDGVCYRMVSSISVCRVRRTCSNVFMRRPIPMDRFRIFISCIRIHAVPFISSVCSIQITMPFKYTSRTDFCSCCTKGSRKRHRIGNASSHLSSYVFASISNISIL